MIRSCREIVMAEAGFTDEATAFIEYQKLTMGADDPPTFDEWLHIIAAAKFVTERDEK